MSESFPSQTSAIGYFAVGVSAIGIINYSALTNVFPQYIYQEYSDDENIQAFAGAFNEISQGYIDWFNQTPLAVYTSSAISGYLLDWIGQGIYGISRPYLTSSSTIFRTGLGYNPIGFVALNTPKRKKSGSTISASDDIYKRVLTWHLYRGDGMQPSIDWLRRRVARFMYGINGTDVSVDDLLNIQITGPSSIGGLITITVPSTSTSLYFQQSLEEGFLALPFQNSFTVTIA